MVLFLLALSPPSSPVTANSGCVCYTARRGPWSLRRGPPPLARSRRPRPPGPLGRSGPSWPPGWGAAPCPRGPPGTALQPGPGTSRSRRPGSPGDPSAEGLADSEGLVGKHTKEEIHTFFGGGHFPVISFISFFFSTGLVYSVKPARCYCVYTNTLLQLPGLCRFTTRAYTAKLSERLQLLNSYLVVMEKLPQLQSAAA